MILTVRTVRLMDRRLNAATQVPEQDGPGAVSPRSYPALAAPKLTVVPPCGGPEKCDLCRYGEFAASPRSNEESK